MNLNKNFIHDNFLLDNGMSQSLFHEVAKKLPVVDFHNHINPQHLASDKMYNNIAELWVNEDPYKHRAMRINGLFENTITGKETSDKDKFNAWAQTLPKTMGNPLFHWSCIELKRVFEIDELLTPLSAERIWNTCNIKLKDKSFSANHIMKRWNVDAICTSDSFFDDLSVHKQASLKSGFIVLPSLRADEALDIDNWKSSKFLVQLSQSNKKEINTLEDLKSALHDRLEYFDKHGCKLSDHALNSGFTFQECPDEKAASIFKNIIANKSITATETVQFQSHLLGFLGKSYSNFGWTMQLHIGAHRETSCRLRRLAGPAGGFATIGKTANIKSLCSFLNTLEKSSLLPNVIIFTLNPSDNEALATLTGSFAEDGIPGKVQFGPAWWYNDHLTGIQDQLMAVSNYSLLSRFVGMTTDSRSIMSFSRHEYFRRILCNLIGNWVEKGLIPMNEEILHELITDISYTNSKKIILNEK
ncbi:glucuronate isomerase [Gelidibacter algens]|uniref:Uronate isomerase n=1 Tax=Gelidibacter algens TaxID=49280 RepID=A0A1A7R413_9FLAO|nr:glucuronate isomerase [Gelidibacter algens]OBX27000.1 uronate isomerase [Gelidibacter algens]RAJ28060.1 glucuronate isomerase [Gelidibacter algens]